MAVFTATGNYWQSVVHGAASRRPDPARGEPRRQRQLHSGAGRMLPRDLSLGHGGPSAFTAGNLITVPNLSTAYNGNTWVITYAALPRARSTPISASPRTRTSSNTWIRILA